jgi:hypothetical protein
MVDLAARREFNETLYPASCILERPCVGKCYEFECFGRFVGIPENTIMFLASSKRFCAFFILSLAGSSVLFDANSTDAANIAYMVDADAILDMPFDEFWVDRLLAQGHDVTVVGDLDPPDAVPGVELFIISNDIGSTNVVPEFYDEPRPVIVFEQALFGELAISTDGAEEIDSVIDVENPDHPLAAGLSGSVEIYEDVQQITRIGDPWADGLEIIATLFGLPVLTVLEPGSVDMNGADAPGRRITIFARDASDGELYTDDGLALLDASVNYALGLGGEGPPELQAGDADMDLDFDQVDLVRVQIAAKYLTGQPATWGQGDWDAAPGGEQGSPPPGNGLFDQLDIIAALGAGKYLTGPYAAISPGGTAGDGQTSIVYDPSTGELSVDAPAGTDLTSINVDSAASIFTGDAAQNLGGSFDNDADNNIFKATFGSSFGSLSFGSAAQAGLSEEFVLNDLTVIGSLAGGGDLGNVDLIYVPEPSAVVLAVLGMLIVMYGYRRKRHHLP